MRRVREPSCRICGCTQERGCPAGCEWADPSLWSVCDKFAEAIANYIEDAWNVSAASIRRLYHETVYPRPTREAPKKRRKKP